MNFEVGTGIDDVAFCELERGESSVPFAFDEMAVLAINRWSKLQVTQAKRSTLLGT